MYTNNADFSSQIIYTSTSSARGAMGTKWQNQVSIFCTAMATNKTRGEKTNARKVEDWFRKINKMYLHI